MRCQMAMLCSISSARFFNRPARAGACARPGRSLSAWAAVRKVSGTFTPPPLSRSGQHPASVGAHKAHRQAPSSIKPHDYSVCLNFSHQWLDHAGFRDLRQHRMRLIRGQYLFRLGQSPSHRSGLICPVNWGGLLITARHQRPAQLIMVGAPATLQRGRARPGWCAPMPWSTRHAVDGQQGSQVVGEASPSPIEPHPESIPRARSGRYTQQFVGCGFSTMTTSAVAGAVLFP